MVNFHHHIGIHLDEAAIAVIGKALIIRTSSKTNHSGIIQAKVQNRIHHPGYGGAARTDRDQQRIGGVGKTGAGFRLNYVDGVANLLRASG